MRILLSLLVGQVLAQDVHCQKERDGSGLQLTADSTPALFGEPAIIRVSQHESDTTDKARTTTQIDENLMLGDSEFRSEKIFKKKHHTTPEATPDVSDSTSDDSKESDASILVERYSSAASGSDSEDDCQSYAEYVREH